MGADIRGQRGRAVSALDLQSEDPGFNTHPNCWLDLFKSPTKVVNNQLVFLYPVGIVSLVTFIGQFQVSQTPVLKRSKVCEVFDMKTIFLILKQMKWSI